MLTVGVGINFKDLLALLVVFLMKIRLDSVIEYVANGSSQVPVVIEIENSLPCGLPNPHDDL